MLDQIFKGFEPLTFWKQNHVFGKLKSYLKSFFLFFFYFLDAGSDLQGIRTNAKKDGDDYILNGSKVFITNGILADVVVVVAITDANAKAKAHGISLFVVEDGMKGFKKGRNL